MRENILYEPDVGVYVDTPKTPKSLRTISLPISIMSMLKELQKYQESERQRVGAFPDRNGYIFANEDGNPMHPDSIGPFLKRFEVKKWTSKADRACFQAYYGKHALYGGFGQRIDIRKIRSCSSEYDG